VIELAHPPAIIRPAPPGLWMPKQEFVVQKKAIVPGLMPMVPPSTSGVALDPFAFSYQGTAAVGVAIASGLAPTGANKRFLIANIGTRSNTSGTVLSTVTIGGVAATILIQAVSGNTTAGIAIAEVTGGTTAAVSVTYTGGAADFSQVSLFRLFNPTSEVPFATINDNTHSSGLVNVSLNTGVGVCIASSMQNEGGTVTMVGVTEHVDVDLNTNEYYSVGSATTTAATPRTITIQSADTTPAQMVGVAASWV
jgi:hypothetical protein